MLLSSCRSLAFHLRVRIDRILLVQNCWRSSVSSPRGHPHDLICPLWNAETADMPKAEKAADPVAIASAKLSES